LIQLPHLNKKTMAGPEFFKSYEERNYLYDMHQEKTSWSYIFTNTSRN